MIKMAPEQILLSLIFCMSECLVQERGSCDFDLLLQVQITDFFYRTTFFTFDILYVHVYELRHDSVA